MAKNNNTPEITLTKTETLARRVFYRSEPRIAAGQTGVLA